jgi:hypothetical protein
VNHQKRLISNQDNAREESHTNPTDNSNLQGNVDENKGYEQNFLGQERAATNTQRAKRKSL